MDRTYLIDRRLNTMHGWFYGYGGSWLWWLGPLFMVFFWGLVITGVVLFIKRLTRFPRGGESLGEDSALELLKKRYVKGEIGREEFEEKKKVLLSR
jgi:putative membrane protein